MTKGALGGRGGGWREEKGKGGPIAGLTVSTPAGQRREGSESLTGESQH